MEALASEGQTLPISIASNETSGTSSAVSNQRGSRKIKERMTGCRNQRYKGRLKELMAELALRDIRYTSKIPPRRAPIKVLRGLLQQIRDKVEVGSGNPERYTIVSTAATSAKKNKVNMKSVTWYLRPASDETEWSSARIIGQIRKGKTEESRAHSELEYDQGSSVDTDFSYMLDPDDTADSPLLQDVDYLSSLYADYGDQLPYPVSPLEHPAFKLPEPDWSTCLQPH